MKPAFVPGIDGLRCLAIGAVFLFHAGTGRLASVGWVGVWLFFCISGFVITRSLADISARSGSVTGYVGEFYKRRALRILPLYAACLAVGTLVLAAQDQLRLALGYLPLLATFTFNFALTSPDYQSSDFFEPLWSLSVEEQFYLLYPFLFFFLRRRLGAVLLCVLAGEPLLRWVIAHAVTHYSGQSSEAGRAVYFLSFLQFDAFAVGALLAINEDMVRRIRGGSAFALLTFLVLVVAMAALQAWGGSGSAYFQFEMFGLGSEAIGYTLINLASGALIVLCLSGNPVSRVLSLAPLAYIGRISYGLYVIHWPLIVGMRAALRRVPALGVVFDQRTLSGRALLFFVTAGILVSLASASYFGFERYFLRLKNRRLRMRASAPA